MHTLITSFVLVFSVPRLRLRLCLAGCSSRRGRRLCDDGSERLADAKDRSAVHERRTDGISRLYLFKMTILFGLLYVFLHVLALNVIGLVVS